MRCGDLSKKIYLQATCQSLEEVILRPMYHRLDRHRELRAHESEVIKQGGTLSSLLFNSVLEFATEDNLKTWREKGMVIKLREEQRPNSLSQFRKMTTDFKWSTEQLG